MYTPIDILPLRLCVIQLMDSHHGDVGAGGLKCSVLNVLGEGRGQRGEGLLI